MQNISDEMDYAFRAGDEDNYPRLDHRFHESFISFSENRSLGSVYDPISLKLRALANNNLVIKMVDEVSHSEHLQIARSFGKKQRDEVKSLLMQHLARFEECLIYLQLNA